MHDENLYAQRALQAGASGFLHKQHAAQNLIVAIQRILDGKIYVSEPIAERMLQQAAGASSSMSPIETLTDRELSVFELTGRGFTIQQIADSCHLSAKTVETYRERAKGKLGLRTSAEFLRHAVKWVTEHAGE
jgi:DNA-binding NarL/FixJ family response regulator